jgi:hypothetical protein
VPVSKKPRTQWKGPIWTQHRKLHEQVNAMAVMIELQGRVLQMLIKHVGLSPGDQTIAIPSMEEVRTVLTTTEPGK